MQVKNRKHQYNGRCAAQKDATDGNTIDKTNSGHGSSQGNYCQGRFGHHSSVLEALQIESCQFEFMSQHLVFANCVPLVLKFFNQNITEYVTMKNNIPLWDFPSCVIGEQPELSAESIVFSADVTDKPYSWRNVFSCINLLRILNKLIKWKHSRVMMLVVFKSAPILKKTLKVRHAMMQLYVLKLLKMQTKYFGRQWRKSNMKTMSAIYSKVRHRLNDDWAFGNDLESRPWDFQAEECTLRACVDRFNLRRYPEATQKRTYPLLHFFYDHKSL